jgi:Icc protein
MADPGTTHKHGREHAGEGTPIRVVQFSDLHLYREADGRLLGQQTRRTLESVLMLAQRRHWPPSAILLTGDLIHDAHEEGYRFLRQRIERLAVPYFCVPGNHDRMDLLAGWVDPGCSSPLRVEPLDGWDLILLDSTIPFEEGGHIDSGVLAELEGYAESHPARPKLVCLHHQPTPVGSAWIDTMCVDNGDALLAAVARHPSIRALAWGHVHQAFEACWGDTLLLSTPSTCVQFLPRSRDFGLDVLTPGYRWFDLYPDGRIETGIERTESYPEPLRLGPSGY